MLFIVLLLAIVAATADDVPVNETTTAIPLPTCVECIRFENSCLMISYLFDFNATFNPRRPVIHKIGLLRSHNMLFYSFEPEFEDKEYYKTGFVNLTNPEDAGIISNDRGKHILNFGTFDMDQDKNMVYFGGSDGIFVLEYKTKRFFPYSSHGDRVNNVFFRYFVYFSKSDDTGIFLKNGDQFREFAEDAQVKKFVVTKNNVIVFISRSGLFVSKGKQEHRISNNPFFRGMTVDLYDTVYVWWIDGIYKVIIEKDMSQSKLVQVAKMDDIGVMAFDSYNNILFTSGKSLYVLQPIDAVC